MSLSPLVSFKSRFVTYLLNFLLKFYHFICLIKGAFVGYKKEFLLLHNFLWLISELIGGDFWDHGTWPNACRCNCLSPFVSL